MARKSTLSLESLIALGAEKLAALVLDEAADNAAFRKRLNAALAGGKGAKAVASLIDRRLAALERAKAMVAWEKERALAEDLAATVDSIAQELAPLDPVAAVERLLRFIDTHASVFERIDDSRGVIQDVYWRAARLFPQLTQPLAPADLAKLPELLIRSLTGDTHGLTREVATSLAPLLPETVLKAWDKLLKTQKAQCDNFRIVRQSIAEATGNVDHYVALELEKPEWQQNTVRVAEKLLAAGRLDEALEWVRRERKNGIRVMTTADLIKDRPPQLYRTDQITLEARILEAQQNLPAAQALRWSFFEKTLNISMLRDYVRKLDDFLEDDELERAFAIVDAFVDADTALDFFIEWPKLERANRLVLAKQNQWDGRYYDSLANAAVILREKYPLSASILYRALLDDILGRGKSAAYGHGARYWEELALLASEISDWGETESHELYAAKIKKAHVRKTGFWAVVVGKKK